MKEFFEPIAAFLSATLGYFGAGLLFWWTLGAILFSKPIPQLVGRLAATLYIAVSLAAFFLISPKIYWFLGTIAAAVLVYLLTLIRRPRSDREWVDEQARFPEISIDGDIIRIKNFRHSVYRSERDFDVHYRDIEFKLSELTRAWFFVQRFSWMKGLAHTFVTFERERNNDDDETRFICVSVEVRREKGETYSPLQGIYRQFELMYVIGDERDLLGARTVMRPTDRVFMYQANATPEAIQHVFHDIAQRVERLGHTPEFYNTFTNNCTNAILRHIGDLAPEKLRWIDPRVVLPGFSGWFAHAKGLIGTPEQSLEELQQAARIDPTARDIGITDDFSERIRYCRDAE